MQGVLGISLATYSLGIAAIRQGRLIDWHIRTFRGKWNDSRLNEVLNTVNSEIDRNKVTNIAIKIPDSLPNSNSFMQLVGSLNVFFETRGLKVFYYSLSEIKQYWGLGKHSTKQDLIKCIIEKYPNLYAIPVESNSNILSYYSRLFEAVAVATKVERDHQ